MRIKTKISITVFVLLFFSIQTAPAFDTAEACYYSDKLKAGDEFTWATSLLVEEEPYPGYIDFLDYYGIANDSIATLGILQAPKGTNFHWESFNASEYDSFFTLTIDGINLSIENSDELLYWFLLYTRIDYINGTSHNPAEDSWVFFVIDDFYFERETALIDITTQGDVVTYNCQLEYDISDIITFKGQIDKSTGLMLYFEVKFEYTDTIYSFIFEIQNYTPRTVSWSYSVTLLPLIAVSIVLIRRRK